MVQKETENLAYSCHLLLSMSMYSYPHLKYGWNSQHFGISIIWTATSVSALSARQCYGITISSKSVQWQTISATSQWLVSAMLLVDLLGQRIFLPTYQLVHRQHNNQCTCAYSNYSPARQAHYSAWPEFCESWFYTCIFINRIKIRLVCFIIRKCSLLFVVM